MSPHTTKTISIASILGKPRNHLLNACLAFMTFACYTQASTPYDFDGDDKADVAVRRASDVIQYIRNSGDQAIQRITFGRDVQDIPVTGDFDGDGIYDVAVRRPSTQYWYIKNSSGEDLITGNADGITRLRFGLQQEDIPVPADYDGDGITDIAVRRPSTQYWYIINSSGIDSVTGEADGITRIKFGRNSEDIPVAADFDGDGKADLAVRRPSTQFWYILNSSGVDYITGNEDGITRRRFGNQQQDIPVPADFDGDGKADLAVRRPSTQFWYILNSSGTTFNSNRNDSIQRIHFGKQAEDIPIVADYDGDGIADIAVRRPANHFQYILRSSDKVIARREFGKQALDIPLAAPVLTRMAMASASQPPPQTDGEVPQADILFPPKIANVDGAETIWVRGVATDNEGVSEVLVNGLSAEIISRSTPNLVESQNFNVVTTQANQEIEWKVNVPVSGALTVSVKDTSGNVNATAASSTLYAGEVPQVLAVDDIENRFFGLSFNSSKLITVDLNTGRPNFISANNGRIDATRMVYASEEKVLITAEDDYDGGFILSEIDPDTAHKKPLATYKVPKNRGEWLFFHISGLEYFAAENSVYINVETLFNGTQNFSHIVKYDLDKSEFIQVIDGEFLFRTNPDNPELDGGMFVYTDVMVKLESGLYVAPKELGDHGYQSNGLVRLDLENNNRKFLGGLTPSHMTDSFTQPDVLYAIDSLDVYKIDANTGAFELISKNNQHEINLSQPGDIEYDSANQNLFVHDSDLDMVMAINTQSGNRLRFIHEGVGEGRALINPRKMVLDEENQVLYVADDGGNADEVILAIDLNNGNRRVVGNVNQRYNVTIEDLLLDKQRNKLFVVFEEVIYVINLSTGRTDQLLDVKNSNLPSDTVLRSATLNDSGDTLLLTERSTLSLYGVNTSNGDVSLLSNGDSFQNSNPNYYVSRDIAVSDENQIAMLSILEGEASIFEINSSDGSRTEITNICQGVPGFQSALEDSPFTLYYTEQDEFILKSYHAAFSFKLNSQTCRRLFDSSHVRNLYDVARSSLDQWYFTTTGTVYQLDIETGQAVILSK